MIRDLPDRLKKLRLQHSYSQKNVADMIGVSPAIISAYETGERTPSTEKIISLSKLYHCSADYLLGSGFQDDLNSVIDIRGLTDKQIQALQVIVDGMKCQVEK